MWYTVGKIRFSYKMQVRVLTPSPPDSWAPTSLQFSPPYIWGFNWAFNLNYHFWYSDHFIQITWFNFVTALFGALEAYRGMSRTSLCPLNVIDTFTFTHQRCKSNFRICATWFYSVHYHSQFDKYTKCR